MGILNVTEDSFSDGGNYADTDAAVKRAGQMIAEGADIIDIGAESTRPDAPKVGELAELERLMPKIRAIRKSFPDIAISVDTYKPAVAELAIGEGADIINDVCADISNGRYLLAELAAKKRAPIIVTHNSRGEILHDGPDFFDMFMRGMRARITAAISAGIPKNQIVADPGFGFGKSPNGNFEIVARLSDMRSLGCAILLGVSRKSSLSETAGDDFFLRDAATAAITAITAFNGSADILRVHDVAINSTAAKTAAKLII